MPGPAPGAATELTPQALRYTYHQPVPMPCAGAATTTRSTRPSIGGKGSPLGPAAWMAAGVHGLLRARLTCSCLRATAQ